MSNKNVKQEKINKSRHTNYELLFFHLQCQDILDFQMLSSDEDS